MIIKVFLTEVAYFKLTRITCKETTEVTETTAVTADFSAMSTRRLPTSNMSRL